MPSLVRLVYITLWRLTILSEIVLNAPFKCIISDITVHGAACEYFGIKTFILEPT